MGGISEGNYADTLQILNTRNVSWSSGPKMNIRRAYFSCIVSSNKNLYAIGGFFISSIEYISTINIAGNLWVGTADGLTEHLEK